MQPNRNEIIGFCKEYLHVDKFKDKCENGLQVEGTDKVNKIITGVSLSLQLIEAAVERRAELILVHHGLFADKTSDVPTVKGVLRKRLKMLLNYDINVAGFHLPLDAHPVIGNNASIAKILGLKKIEPFDIGFVGNLAKEEKIQAFVKSVNRKFGKDSYVITGSKKARRVAIVSGGSSGYYEKALETGADTFICGEMFEFVVRAAEESGINLIAAGHYNTEKLGIINLGKLVEKKFKIKAEFVDVPCEI